jgi:hypothetical protein
MPLRKEPFGAHLRIRRIRSSYLFPGDAQALNTMATDAGNSTFDALIHTQLDITTGLTVGGQVGQQVVTRAPQADGAN